MRFARATLEVCQMRLQYYQGVADFIEEKLANYKNVALQWRGNQSPRLLLHDIEGNVLDTIRIDAWKTEHIEAFLGEKLQSL
eukprot:SM000027S09705  [mRNA]  locus=s27:939509:940038:+ [translate_table: standard]